MPELSCSTDDIDDTDNVNSVGAFMSVSNTMPYRSEPLDTTYERFSTWDHIRIVVAQFFWPLQAITDYLDQHLPNWVSSLSSQPQSIPHALPCLNASGIT